MAVTVETMKECSIHRGNWVSVNNREKFWKEISEKSWFEPVRVPPGFSEADRMYRIGNTQKAMTTRARMCLQPTSVHHRTPRRRGLLAFSSFTVVLVAAIT